MCVPHQAGGHPPKEEYVPLLTTANNLLNQYLNLCSISQLHLSSTERKIALTCMTVIHNNIKLIHNQIQLKFKLGGWAAKTTLQYQQKTNLLSTLTRLWVHLSFPHETDVRLLLFKIILIVEDIINTFSGAYKTEPFQTIQKPNKPSILNQVVHRPINIVNPYLTSLQRNYYYPIATEIVTMSEEIHTEQYTGLQDVTTTDPEASKHIAMSSTVKSKLATPEVITVEDSLTAITDLIREIEADDPPQSNLDDPVTTPSVKASTYRHRFALYRRNANYQSTLSQLSLFRSFAKCLKNTDNSIQILPIRNDIKVNSLSTTDQINHLEAVGLPTYFRPYKKNQKHISGDYYIATKLSFEELREHQNVQTWLIQSGYQMLWNDCQSSDMVKIGFLSRVRSFTFRDDLQSYITASKEWRAAPFQFRIYFDAFAAKGKVAYVLMIDAERPKIDQALHFFQSFYDGKKRNSPNCIEYFFLPLYRKSYSEDDRLKIIADHKHFVGNDSVVAMKGLHPLDNLVKLVSGVHTTIRHLLLSVPTKDCGNLFVQVERQPVDNWMLCCFHSHNSTKVTQKLGILEESLRKIVPQECWTDLFIDENGLTFSGQAAPLLNKKHHIARHASPQTEAYVAKSFKQLFNPTPKRNASDMDDYPSNTEQPVVKTRSFATASAVTESQPNNLEVNSTPTQNTLVHHTLNIAAVTPAPRTAATTELGPNNATAEVQVLRDTANLHSSALLALEKCCTTLMATQTQMSADIYHMNEGFNKRFEEFSAKMEDMTEAISNLKHSPSRSGSKVRKEHHALPDVPLLD